MQASKPSFDSLPLRKDGPHGNAWGLFGDNDSCGMLNLLTPEIVAAAAREIVDGVRVSTDLRLNHMVTPCFGRAPFEHRIKNKAPRSVNDDTVIFNTQVGSQWDGFRHYGYQAEQLYFGGRTLDQLLNSDAIGVQAWAEKGGIMTRGVLLDYAAWADAKGQEIKPFTTAPITASTLDEIAAYQGTQLSQGDVVIVRTGWMRAFNALSSQECQAIAALQSPPAIGLESSEATLRWIWEKGLVAVAGDQPSMEAWPCQNTDYFLHEWLLAGWGVPIGELFDLEELSRVCAEKKRWSFFFSSQPIKVPGGVASPPNGVAIF